jgi:starch phosphorylase
MECEPDAALGNGGLGRLAACFLDSMATLGLPSWGYGVRYEYGMFAQSILNGQQVEKPEAWLQDRSPWEFPRANKHYTVRFGGTCRASRRMGGMACRRFGRSQGFRLRHPRSWYRTGQHLAPVESGRALEIDLGAFNTGDYQRAAEFKNRFENISWVLYPTTAPPPVANCACARSTSSFRHRCRTSSLATTPSTAALQSRRAGGDPSQRYPPGDQRRRVDAPAGRRTRDAWAAAWEQCRRIFSYTNHTLMPEALETWKVTLMQRVLPRHMLIIYRINQEFLDEVVRLYPGDIDLMRRVSLIDDGGGHDKDKRVRMAHLCIVGSHRVNGVSQLHSDLMVQTIFADFARLYPERFHNKTNGVTPRRWLAQANPGLSTLLDERLGGKDWRLDLDRLQELRASADDAGFRTAFATRSAATSCAWPTTSPANWASPRIPTACSTCRSNGSTSTSGSCSTCCTSSPATTRCSTARPGLAPRSVIFAGKAASSYHMAKQVIRLIHDVAAVVNNDPRTRDLLQVVFIPNYGVSVAELIMPAANLSEQISTAGTEASGTGNMKLSLNGALTIGTEDGANIEIRDNVGADNIFIFGNNTAQVNAIRQAGYQPIGSLPRRSGAQGGARPHRQRLLLARRTPALPRHFQQPAALRRPLPAARRLRRLCRHAGARRRPLSDPRRVAAQGNSQRRRHGPFSADRTIADYANDTWNLGTLTK